MNKPHIGLADLNLEEAERRLCTGALLATGNLVAAAELLGVTRFALKRRLARLGVTWPNPDGACQPTRDRLK